MASSASGSRALIAIGMIPTTISLALLLAIAYLRQLSKEGVVVKRSFVPVVLALLSVCSFARAAQKVRILCEIELAEAAIEAQHMEPEQIREALEALDSNEILSAALAAVLEKHALSPKNKAQWKLVKNAFSNLPEQATVVRETLATLLLEFSGEASTTPMAQREATRLGLTVPQYLVLRESLATVPYNADRWRDVLLRYLISSPGPLFEKVEKRYGWFARPKHKFKAATQPSDLRAFIVAGGADSLGSYWILSDLAGLDRAELQSLFLAVHRAEPRNPIVLAALNKRLTEVTSDTVPEPEEEDLLGAEWAALDKDLVRRQGEDRLAARRRLTKELERLDERRKTASKRVETLQARTVRQRQATRNEKAVPLSDIETAFNARKLRARARRLLHAEVARPTPPPSAQTRRATSPSNITTASERLDPLEMNLAKEDAEALAIGDSLEAEPLTQLLLEADGEIRHLDDMLDLIGHVLETAEENEDAEYSDFSAVLQGIYNALEAHPTSLSETKVEEIRDAMESLADGKLDDLSDSDCVEGQALVHNTGWIDLTRKGVKSEQRELTAFEREIYEDSMKFELGLFHEAEDTDGLAACLSDTKTVSLTPEDFVALAKGLLEESAPQDWDASDDAKQLVDMVASLAWKRPQGLADTLAIELRDALRSFVENEFDDEDDREEPLEAVNNRDQWRSIVGLAKGVKTPNSTWAGDTATPAPSLAGNQDVEPAGAALDPSEPPAPTPSEQRADGLRQQARDLEGQLADRWTTPNDSGRTLRDWVDLEKDIRRSLRLNIDVLLATGAGLENVEKSFKRAATELHRARFIAASIDVMTAALRKSTSSDNNIQELFHIWLAVVRTAPLESSHVVVLFERVGKLISLKKERAGSDSDYVLPDGPTEFILNETVQYMLGRIDGLATNDALVIRATLRTLREKFYSEVEVDPDSPLFLDELLNESRWTGIDRRDVETYQTRWRQAETRYRSAEQALNQLVAAGP